jgi:outer membrane protein OmpA-like peptidoglycan-associated protein
MHYKIQQRSWIVPLSLFVATLAVPLFAPPAFAKRPAAPRTATLKVTVDKSHALDEHRLEIRMSRPAGKVRLMVTNEDGRMIVDDEFNFAGKPANAPLTVRWDQKADEPIGTISLRMYDKDDNYIEQEYSAWYVPIPHEEVSFRSDSSDLDASEIPKLEEAFLKVQEVLAKDKAKEHKNLTLYVAGHTDTVGIATYNLRLSQLRAQSLAKWFRQRGVRIPIAYEGFGEFSLRVSTADQTDEPKNRRADYILADDAPPMKGTGFKPSWKRIN